MALAFAVVPFLAAGNAQTTSSPKIAQQRGTAAAIAPSGNIAIVAGCVASPLASDIIFAAQPSANGALTRPPQQLPPTSSAAVPVGTTGSTVVNGFDLANPQNALACGAIVQDIPPDIDANPNTVDTGTITYTLQTLGGRFEIINSGGPVYSVQCGETSGSSPGFEGCLGGLYTAGASIVTPNPALVVKVGLAPGVPLSSLGTLTGVAGLSGLSLTATYTRDPSLSANPAAVPPGPETASTTVALGILTPTYQLGLAAVPAAIPASPQFVSPSAPGAAIQGQGSVITASLATVNTALAGAVVIGVPSATNTVGAEPGTVTFSTNLGVFGDQPQPLSAGKQMVVVACGNLPGFVPAYNPATFSFQTYSFTSCQTATTTLYGAGQAGEATVVATFMGSITGTQVQGATLVALSSAPSVIALARGCNQVTTPASMAANTPASTYVYNYIIPSGSVSAVWQYNNATQSFQGLYFTVGAAPTLPNPVVGPNESLYVCLATPTTVIVASPSPSPTPAPSATPLVVSR